MPNPDELAMALSLFIRRRYYQEEKWVSMSGTHCGLTFYENGSKLQNR